MADLHQTDQVIGDRFRLRKLIGQGAMGSVWSAHDTSLGIDVAVKFIETALDEGMLTRFTNEARVVARIKSPHVIQVIDFAARPGVDPYIAMELLKGESLGDRLERERTLSLTDTLTLVRHVVKGLTKAHALGVVHRDVKPDNLFLVPDEDGEIVKILDFGVAKTSLGASGNFKRTSTGQVIGTPLYMSPEQARGRSNLDWSSDMFSLAMVAYQCLVGDPPFLADTLGDLIIAISMMPHTPPTALNPALPPGLDEWFLRALAKEPHARFQSPKQFVDAFASACESGPIVAGQRIDDKPRLSVQAAVDSSRALDVHLQPLPALPPDLLVTANMSATDRVSGAPRRRPNAVLAASADVAGMTASRSTRAPGSRAMPVLIGLGAVAAMVTGVAFGARGLLRPSASVPPAAPSTALEVTPPSEPTPRTAPSIVVVAAAPSVTQSASAAIPASAQSMASAYSTQRAAPAPATRATATTPATAKPKPAKPIASDDFAL